MPETYKYILTLIVILLLILFCYLIYKIVKSTETIKENEEQIDNMTNVIASRDSVIKQMIKNKGAKSCKPEKSDQETDYFNNKVPIEVFNDKASEMQKKNSVNKCPIRNSPQQENSLEIETPVFDNNVNAINNAIGRMIDNCSKEEVHSAIIHLSSDKQVNNLVEKINNTDEQILCSDENSFSTSSIINNAISNIEVDVTDKCNDYSDTMYIVKDDDIDSIQDEYENSSEVEESEVKIENVDVEDVEEIPIEEEVEEDEEEEVEEEKEDVEDEEVSKENQRIVLQKLNLSDVKSMARNLKIKLSNGSRQLIKKELIEKILEE
jgi:hypothetical protein